MTPIFPQDLWNDLVRYLNNDPHSLIARYILDFNADYLDTPTSRRRTLAYIALVLLAFSVLVAVSGLVPGVDMVMGWK